MEKIINPCSQAVPTVGTVGYVHVENKHYDGQDITPRLFEVDIREIEIVS